METSINNKIPTTFGGSFNNGWEIMKKHFLVLLLVVFIVGAIVAPGQMISSGFNPEHFDWSQYFDRGFDHGWNNSFDFFNGPLMAVGMFASFLALLALAYNLLLVPVFQFGSKLIFIHATRDKRPEFETLIIGFKENYLHIILANLLTVALIMMGFIFIIVPGIIIACRLAFVQNLVMDKKLDPIMAVEESWKMTKGYGWTIFAMGFVSMFIFLAGLMMCFVGVFPATIWVKSSFASLYEGIRIEREAQLAEVVE